jgi:hypothetical protein
MIYFTNMALTKSQGTFSVIRINVETNFKRGGKENDAVIANAQDGSGFNNANFATPPDVYLN